MRVSSCSLVLAQQRSKTRRAWADGKHTTSCCGCCFRYLPTEGPGATIFVVSLLKVVVLGTGWAAHALLKEIDASKFEVTVVSPRNFFLFTPMLAASAVGTVKRRKEKRVV